MLTRYFNSFKVEKTPWSSTPTAMPDAGAAAPEAIEIPVRDTDTLHDYHQLEERRKIAERDPSGTALIDLNQLRGNSAISRGYGGC